MTISKQYPLTILENAPTAADWKNIPAARGSKETAFNSYLVAFENSFQLAQVGKISCSAVLPELFRKIR